MLTCVDPDGRTVAFDVVGEGPPVVLIPPVMVGQTVYRELVRDLARDHQLIRFELPGHRGSSPWREGVSLDGLAQQVASVLDHLGHRRATLVGYSLGSCISLQFAGRFPERTRAVFAVGAFPRTTAVLRTCVRLACWSTRTIPRTSALAFAFGNARRWSDIPGMFQAGCLADPATSSALFASLLPQPCLTRLPEISAPVFLVCGRWDGYAAPYQRELQRRIPGSTLTWVPQVGHQVPPKQPRVLAAIIRAHFANDSSQY
ncbi:MAG: alpha/beta hydrolase [Alicyclobacillus sp.]|nr:alpha/beta hydrolase [Alicyclobacillus sp.]